MKLPSLLLAQSLLHLISPSNAHTLDRAAVLHHEGNAAKSDVNMETEFIFPRKKSRFICTIIKQNTSVGLGRASNTLPASVVLGLWVNKWLSIIVLKYLLTLIIIIRAPRAFYLEKSKKFHSAVKGRAINSFNLDHFRSRKYKGICHEWFHSV